MDAPPCGGAGQPVTLVLVRGATELRLGPAESGDRCGLDLVDALLHLQVAVRRFGWTLRLDDVPSELEELLDLVGLRDQL